MVLKGVVSKTLHSWNLEHTFPIAHGFWHRLLMQPSREGQSESWRHSGSASIGVRVPKKFSN